MSRIVLALAVGMAGCGYFQGPRLSMTTAPGAKVPEAVTVQRATAKPRAPSKYHGWTAERWAEALEHRDRESIRRAAQALKVLGAEGRPYLIAGLESSNPETRRFCLEVLTVADFRVYGEQGKQLLVKLAGDPVDLRIRERANQYILQWNQAIPAP